MKTQYLKAKNLINQIENDEWEFIPNSVVKKCMTAERNYEVLWFGDGPLFLNIDDMVVFNMFFGLWVWWVALRKAVKKANKEYKKQLLEANT